MTPVIRHLRTHFLELPLPAEDHSLNWTFDARVKRLGPDFYSKVVSMHPVLNMEYSILCNQLRHHFSFPGQINKEQIIDQLTAALMFAELLEHLHLHYLIVPREVARLRRHQEVYRGLLREMGGYIFTPQPQVSIQVGLSLSQQVRENTALINWFRLLFTRSKRVLNFLDLVGTGSETYRNLIGLLDKYTNPILAYVAWCFFIPRFATNLFLLVKHTIPWPWMDDKEKDLGWWTRLEAQVKRRWFELANDSVWITVGLLNCFVLIGALAPLSIYVTLFAFAFDIANTSLRAYIELNRLYKLQQEYSALLQKEENPEKRRAIQDHQNFITHRIEFEKLRLGLSVATTTAVFIAMCFALPMFAVNPVIPFIGALLLIAIWVASYTLTLRLEQYRPNDAVERPSNVATLGFFACKPKEDSSLSYEQKLTSEEDFLASERYSFV
ncbi:hypothetical protein [Legionella maioricensis]|uniref:Coiled-coil protein n=1 Tax=Legionella maioricensis TaxID=2896528 RepID=A0A9X2IBP5_9GAMM|nr:hypothetical protein [Legionella maioricensis]MCL9684441.1 hypothetical protein [Legionella maioricensis]MCL9689256.1 hypothetical protein [Legionella maioricensis]